MSDVHMPYLGVPENKEKEIIWAKRALILNGKYQVSKALWIVINLNQIRAI